MMDDEEIERVARKICASLGVNPDDQVGCGCFDDETPEETANRLARAGGNFIPGILLYSPRWRLYRCKAAEAIAAREALVDGAL